MSDEVNEVTQADERSPAQFFFEMGFGACYAEAMIRGGDKVPFPISDDFMEQQWIISQEAYEDPSELDAMLARTAFQASAGEGLRVLKGWLDWYRFATGDDDCQYLNDKGWDDAEALASTTMGVLATLTTPVEASQPVGDAGGRRQRIIADINAAIGLGEHGVTVDVEQAADSILASLSPPTSDERLRLAYLAGYMNGAEDGSEGGDHKDCATEGWVQYRDAALNEGAA